MENVGKLIAELQEMQDNGYLSDALLRAAVRKLKESDSRYDWVGVYLLNHEAGELWLHNYVGAGTEHAKIPVGTGVCGTAVSEGQNQRIDDVSTVENYLSCDPDVKSEMVVLIRNASQIFGQIDVDSKQKAAFSEEDEFEVKMIADKLAEQIAIERA
ncbi:MAG: GAF domain-containing protein [Gemmatimonadota bacterium]